MRKTLVLAICLIAASASAQEMFYNVLDYGAKGDGKTKNTEAINAAIDAAAENGGGTVFFPAGDYLSYTIRLRNRTTLHLDQGAVLIGDEEVDGVGYDLPEEPTLYKEYQDFGHSYWRNSLIYGDGLHDIAITGHGMIWGRGLQTYEKPNMKGSGNKTIGLRNCRNVTIRDIAILRGGHFCVLATGVDNLTIDNVRADANRDAFDIDCCRNVVVSNCTVNSPVDDGICLKSSFALGYARATENVTITNCQVFGYDHGSLMDGTFRSEFKDEAPGANHCITGRLKLGTESNGGFKNIAVSNCVFERSRGLCIETADGGVIEDVVFDNITMRDVTDTPFFIRLNARMRGPEGTPVGTCKRITISNLNVYDVGGRPMAPGLGAGMVMGIPGRYIEDLTLSNIRIYCRGGGSKDAIDQEVPQNVEMYPDPYRWKSMPAYGMYFRYVKGLRVHDVVLRYINGEERPAFVLDDVHDACFYHIDAQKGANAPQFILRNASGVSIHGVNGVEDTEPRQGGRTAILTRPLQRTVGILPAAFARIPRSRRRLPPVPRGGVSWPHGSQTLLREVSLKHDEVPDFGEYPFSIPAVSALDTLEFHPDVTFLVGENGAGKSTLVEAIALAMGFGPEGGTKNVQRATADTVSGLHDYLKVVKSFARPRDHYFLRAESFYNVATYMDEVGYLGGYGDKSLHARSHGESFMATLTLKLRGKGLYIFDEPEAALSPTRQMAALSAIHQLVERESQFIIATHSPILMAYPARGSCCSTKRASRLSATRTRNTMPLRRTF